MQAISGSFGVLAYAIGALFGNIVLIYAAVGIVLVLAIGPPFLIEEPRDLVPAPAQRDTDASWRGVAASLSPLSALLVYDIVALATRLIGVTPPRFVGELLCIPPPAVLIGHALSRAHPSRPNHPPHTP